MTSICRKCGKPILWRPKLLDPEIAYAGPKPLNENETIHSCTKEIKYPRVKASVIICPVPRCNYACIERDKKLIDEFKSHIKSHLIKFKDFAKIEERIDYLRHTGSVHYIDPFLHVPLEEITHV